MKFACYSRCFLTSYFCIPVPYMKRASFLGVLKGLVGLHRTAQLQLLQGYCLGHRLGLPWYWVHHISVNQISLYQLCTLYLWNNLSPSNHHVSQIIFIFHINYLFSSDTSQITASIIEWILPFLSLATCCLSPAVDNKVGISPEHSYTFPSICLCPPKSPGNGRK